MYINYYFKKRNFGKVTIFFEFNRNNENEMVSTVGVESKS